MCIWASARRGREHAFAGKLSRSFGDAVKRVRQRTDVRHLDKPDDGALLIVIQRPLRDAPSRHRLWSAHAHLGHHAANAMKHPLVVVVCSVSQHFLRQA